MIARLKRLKTFDIFLLLFCLIVVFITLYPFWNLAVVSLNDPQDTLRGELYFWPRKFSGVSYETIFKSNKDLVIASINSVSRTVIGTILNVTCSTLVAYALSRKYFVLRKFMNRFVVLTMYVTAGLIPQYILYLNLGLINSFAVYIVPHLLSAFNIIILKTYMQEISPSLHEAAIIDGASESQVMFRVVLPLCTPVLATVALFIAVFQWSQWQDTFFFANNPKANLTTLQYEMMKIIRSSTRRLTDSQLRDAATLNKAMATPESLQAAMTMIATIPILIVYPFLQKYFVSGITIGAIKE